VSDAPAAQATDPSLPEPGAGRRFKRFFLLLLFYVAIGPPVGSMVFMTCSAVMQVRSVGDLQYLPLAPFVGLMLAPFAYILGALPVAFGGLFVAGWQAFLGRVSFAGILTLGTVLATGFAYAMERAASGRPVVDRGAVVTMFLTALLPAVICWYPMRKRYYPPTSSPDSVKDVKHEA
jgi:hypothetical protein